MTDKIRIFVGTPANNDDLECQAVFDWSLRKHHPQDDVEITWMMLSPDPNSFWYSNMPKKEGWNTKGWATPFTPFRFGIPAFCNYEGKAIYCDCDQIFLADVLELWNQEIPDGKCLLMAKDGASCVMLMDCKKMKSILPPINDLKSVQGLFRGVRGKVVNYAGVYSGDWNCRDGISSFTGKPYATIYDPDVKILHYTMIPTQPNHRHARMRLKAEGKPHWYPGPDRQHPKQEVTDLFDMMLEECVAAGKGPETFRVSQEFGAYGR